MVDQVQPLASTVAHTQAAAVVVEHTQGKQMVQAVLAEAELRVLEQQTQVAAVVAY
jgi:phage terminase large subunit-like protein